MFSPPFARIKGYRMASMRWTFKETYTKVSEFLGLGSSPGTADLAKVKDIVYRGYMKFLLPLNPRDSEIYIWSFLKQEWKITLEAGKWEYPLPEDFERFHRKLEYDAGERTSILTLVPHDIIMRDRNVVEWNSFPSRYAIRTAKFDQSVGSRKELVVYPTPNGTHIINSTYVMTPSKMEQDGDFFIGGPLESEAILQCCLAVAENQEDEVLGVETQKAVEMIQSLIRKDKGESPDTVGEVIDGNIGGASIMDYRAWWIPTATFTIYGTDI